MCKCKNPQIQNLILNGPQITPVMVPYNDYSQIFRSTIHCGIQSLLDARSLGYGTVQQHSWPSGYGLQQKLLNFFLTLKNKKKYKKPATFGLRGQKKEDKSKNLVVLSQNRERYLGFHKSGP